MSSSSGRKKSSSSSSQALSSSSSSQRPSSKPRSSPFGVEFEFKHDFDENGLIYHLGTEGKTKPFENPAESGLVKVECSNLASDSVGTAAIVGRKSARCVSKAESGSWFSIDMGGNASIVPTHYTLRHYSSWDTEALRNWVFEAEDSCGVFVVLSQHINDTRLEKKGQSHTWEIIPKVEKSYSHFRIRQTGVNSNNHYYLALSGFEIYGRVDGPMISGSLSTPVNKLTSVEQTRQALKDAEAYKINAENLHNTRIKEMTVRYEQKKRKLTDSLLREHEDNVARSEKKHKQSQIDVEARQRLLKKHLEVHELRESASKEKQWKCDHCQTVNNRKCEHCELCQKRKPRGFKELEDQVEELKHKAKEAAAETNECNICMAAPRDTIILNCGHFNFCHECVKDLATCPSCRSKIERLQRVFQ